MHSVDRLTVRITREWIEYTPVPFAVLRTSNECIYIHKYI